MQLVTSVNWLNQQSEHVIIVRVDSDLGQAFSSIDYIYLNCDLSSFNCKNLLSLTLLNFNAVWATVSLWDRPLTFHWTSFSMWSEMSKCGVFQQHYQW